MEKQFVTTSASPHIQLNISGDLRLKGQDAFEVVAKSDDAQNLILDARDDQVTINCNSDCTVRVPLASIVQIQAVRGDTTIKNVEGDLDIEEADGELELRNIGDARIGTIRGNLAAKNVDGSLAIDTAYGDVSVRRVQGDFTISGTSNGNLTLSDVGGNAKASINGNIMLRLDPAPGHTYEFQSNGNQFCRLPDDSSVEISVPKAAKVMVNLPGIHASAPVQSPYAITLGDGEAKLILSADGNVVLDTHAPDWDMENFDLDIDSEVEGVADTVSQQITDQVESQMRMIEDQLNMQLSSLSMRLSAAKLSEDQVRRIEERARMASERATARAQEHVRRAQERMEQKLAAAQRKIEHKAQARERASRHGQRGWSFTVPSPSGFTSPASEPVSEDERLMILRMLEQKKISMEEAEELLSALEGKS